MRVFCRPQVEHVKAERNVLAEVHNPYVVKLYYSFDVRHWAGCGFESLVSVVYLLGQGERNV